jgi:DNA-binding MarR family transcriptional regulator
MERAPFRDSEIYKLHEICIRLDGYAQARLLPPLGITYPEFLVLMAVEETAHVTHSDMATHSDVAAMLEMSKSLVSQRVSALEKKGLLRQAVNTSNKREHHLVLNSKGKAVVSRAFDALLSAADGVFAALGGGRKRLNDALDRVLAQLRTLGSASAST